MSAAAALARDDETLRRRAWDAAAEVCDPEIPVLTIADLGVLRGVEVVDGRVEVTITPTYSGCPAMQVIADSVREALRARGIDEVRLGDGTEASHAKTQAAVNYLWMYSGEAFIYDAIDEAMVAQGVAPPAAGLRAAFLEHVAEIFAEATLAMPDPAAWMQQGGKQGRHSEHLGFILAEMQFLQRAYPGAQW